MEDSIEDYIKISSNKIDDTVSNKESKITAIRKKECDVRAMKIVEFSIEGKLRPEVFSKCLPYITKSHYQDIVEERAVTKLCGYSLCGKRIPEMPKKQYFISTKNNKVYDITDRKNYCRNYCYKASIHIKNQINDSPLWLRKLDDIPEYQLLDSSDSGLPGEYIDQGIAKPVVQDNFMPVSIFTDASLQDIIDSEKSRQKTMKKAAKRKSSKPLKSTMQTINESAEHIQETDEISISVAGKENRNLSNEEQKETSQSSLLKDLPVIAENEEQEVPKHSESSKPIKISIGAKSKKSRKNSRFHKVDVETIIKTSLQEWLTIESYVFLFGEKKIKQILDENKLSDYFDKLNIANLRSEQQVKYMEICKRLHLQELADDKFDKATLGNSKLKPIPDYQKLKADNKELTIKVKCFYRGVLQNKDNSNSAANTNDKSVNKNEEEPPAVLPLVDVNFRTALRRKIFLSSINKSMQQLLQGLRVPSLTPILTDLQSLVKTFRLDANNIVFKPLVYNCIALVLLNILALRDETIKSILQEKSSKEFTDLFVASIANTEEFLNQTIERIKNIDAFVEEYILLC